MCVVTYRRGKSVKCKKGSLNSEDQDLSFSVIEREITAAVLSQEQRPLQHLGKNQHRAREWQGRHQTAEELLNLGLPVLVPKHQPTPGAGYHFTQYSLLLSVQMGTLASRPGF